MLIFLAWSLILTNYCGLYKIQEICFPIGVEVDFPFWVTEVFLIEEPHRKITPVVNNSNFQYDTVKNTVYKHFQGD